MAKIYDTKDHPFELRHEVKRLNTRLDDIATALEKSDFKDIIENYTSPKKRIITNFTAGLSRGLGLTVGTAVVLALLGWMISAFVDLPLIGKYIGQLQEYINAYKQQ
ncbi:DUF5665 domain-containing protein [Paenibacillus pinistramenti]|uniref:DUF5665 domain-containing protein n=1 Tax=Paenibacillus pinistramenti TaxID=1768003 RepID=UPI00110804AD|nr:DUF5665 domain-containing protein [Paenibacillus pinistramenti]